MIDPSSLTLQYEGSVKNVFSSPKEPQFLWFAFTDQYSVFDWGKMPDLIANKGTALAVMAAHIFQTLANPAFWQKLPQSPKLHKFDGDYLAKRFAHPVFSGKTGLARNGLKTHFHDLYKGTMQAGHWLNLKPFTIVNNKGADDPRLVAPFYQIIMEVLAAKVNWPEHKTIQHENIYFYPPTPATTSERRLIPLEVVFRFGMVEGSSLQKKLEENPKYIDALGLKTVPKMNEWFPHPVIEFFTKLEGKDRLLNWQEASLLANLTPNQFEWLVEGSMDIALALHVLFAESKLELWDGKLEFILEGSPSSGHFLLADSVGPDELRLLHNGVQLSKEVLRQYYRPSDWAKAIPEAQNIAKLSGQEDWQDVCKNKLNQRPERLRPDMKRLVDQLYGVIANQVLGFPAFPSHPEIEAYTATLKDTLAKHIAAHEQEDAGQDSSKNTKLGDIALTPLKPAQVGTDEVTL
jgi:phosphoribosylaminoimidazole-succinocarboxamide synthase